MNNISVKLEKYFNPSIMMYILLIWSLLSCVGFIDQYANMLSKFIGIISLVFFVINIRKIRLNSDTLLMGILFICILISNSINYSNELYLNIVMLIFMIGFVGLSLVSRSINQSEIRQNKFMYIYIVFVTLFSCISLILLFLNIEIPINNGYLGVHWNVFYGTYLNPNTGSICTVFAIFFIVYLFLKKKSKMLMVAFVLNCIYLYFADSRGSLLTLITFIFVFLFFKLLILNKKKIILFGIVFVYVISVGVVIISPYKIVNKIISKIDYAINEVENTNHKTPLTNGKSETNSKNNEVNLEANKNNNTNVKKDAYSVNTNISSSRFTLWKAGINVISDNFIFGVGKSGQMNQVKIYLNQSSEESTIVAGGVHNGYLDLILSNGIIAFLALMVFFAKRLLNFLINLIRNKEKIKNEYLLFISIFVALLINNFVETSFFNAIFISCVFVWYAISNILILEEDIKKEI